MTNKFIPCPSSLKTSSLFSFSFSFFPLLLFLPPFPENRNAWYNYKTSHLEYKKRLSLNDTGWTTISTWLAIRNFHSDRTHGFVWWGECVHTEHKKCLPIYFSIVKNVITCYCTAVIVINRILDKQKRLTNIRIRNVLFSKK